MAQSPQISVIMPSYRASRYLPAAIESVLNQTYHDWELIVVDDASTDGSGAILGKYAAASKQITVLENKNRLGAAAARNRALAIARGKYIAILDADDIALPDRLRTQFEFMEKHPDIFLVGSSYENIDEEGKRINGVCIDLDHDEFVWRLERGLVTRHSTVMYRNTPNLYYREKLSASHDTDFLLRMVTEARRLCCIPDVLVQYRLQRESIGNRSRARQTAYAKKARRWYRQRVERGEDDYASFDSTEIERLTCDEDADFVLSLRTAAARYEERKRGIYVQKVVLKRIWTHGIRSCDEARYFLSVLTPDGIKRLIRFFQSYARVCCRD